ncbi:hypothetical protein BJY01DRAFT_251376 [Aspergillus pseudoustus]|uniref:Concanavalin A-like lectin/glucanase domain-containing protein n=1 Tax=Aspergillus pseudoustus TaxID=1810923 RepID=A0ABR4JD96_9EURO
MMGFSTLWSGRALTVLLALGGFVSAISLEVSAQGGNSSSPLLYGFMFEDINYSGDGGIHCQMLRNNGFKDPSATLDRWAAVGTSVTIAIDTENPLTEAIPRSLRLDIADATAGDVGVSNSGYWGISVDGSKHYAAFWFKGTYTGPVTVKMIGSSTGTVYGTSTTQVGSIILASVTPSSCPSSTRTSLNISCT